MSLHSTLATARTEEDVKAAYIKALGLKNVSRNLIDIQTDEIWFEAKDTPHSVYDMFTQLLHYVRAASQKGEHIPPLLAVCDCEKAALMQTSDVLHIFDDKTIVWSKSASGYTKPLVEKISPMIGAHLVQYRMETHEAEFISTVKKAIATGQLMKTQITPHNLRHVFDKWMLMVGQELPELPEPADYALVFFADIMYDDDEQEATHDLPAQLLHKGRKPVFVLKGSNYELASLNGYEQFWAIYHRPPHEDYRNDLMERVDTLLPTDERMFKGAFYTPFHLVDKAYETLADVLGNNWQDEYIVWDMCCGVGNLERNHTNPRNIYMSTLDQKDIDLMESRRFMPVADKFQYDYLNDDIAPNKKIDYTITNKLPTALRATIDEAKAGTKKILVLINPPYAEAGSTLGSEGKSTVAKTKMGEWMGSNYGKASNELFTQFVVRIQQEMPNAVIAMFSTLKYVNAPNFEKFRTNWKAQYLGGFVVHSKAFEDLSGNFPIGFLLWNTAQKQDITQITAQAIDKKAIPIGEKTFYNLPNSTFLNVWIDRPKANKVPVVPLKNTVSVFDASEASLSKWSDGAIGYMWCDSNSPQKTSTMTVLFSSVYGLGHGFYITPANLWQAAVVFSVRRLIKPTWLNDRDQFLQPTQPLSDEFKSDCLVWMLFSGSNLTAGADGLEWNDRQWSLVNHFIPFTEEEVGANGRFESNFMSEYLRVGRGGDVSVRTGRDVSVRTGRDLSLLSPEAQAVMDAGRELWRAYFSTTDERKVRDALKLNRPDVGWYQVRKALEARNSSGQLPVSFDAFKEAYTILSDKLRPLVYELGFLR